ncbi:DegV family protein [Streptococcus moroccensis]|uniref:DegV family protein with EDD domain n=1 Tax=Streptococcus moroccensis TaxID=1451356 RepID=A0ABT9YQV6_9STRE|nr:DegV family protein [Streptococcus moroccensis]MDQ0222272.1 DegV family protein with EDD domain [Streptococcus moroccensis]
MSKIKIVTDSCISIEPEVVADLGITIVPLSVMVDGVLYSDDTLKEGEFLQLMKNAKALPKTSQPPVGLFAETYETISNPEDQIISIHTSHALSGTVEAARQAGLLASREVTVVDSTFTDQSLKFQVVEAAKLAKAGASKDAILAKIEEVRSKSQLFIGISTLENLVKGGRISRVSGMMSSLLNIKVVMEMVDHQLQPILKGRGTKTFAKWLDSFIAQAEKGGRKVAEIGISYAGVKDYAMEMKEKLSHLVAEEISVLETGSIIQTHTGEDAWAVLVRYE